MGTLAVGAAVGAGIGLLKQAEQERQHQRQSELAAKQTQLSGLAGSGIEAGQVGQGPSLFDNVAGGALAGGQFGQNVAQSQFQGDFQQAQLENLQKRNEALGLENQNSVFANAQQGPAGDPNRRFQ